MSKETNSNSLKYISLAAFILISYNLITNIRTRIKQSELKKEYYEPHRKKYNSVKSGIKKEKDNILLRYVSNLTDQNLSGSNKGKLMITISNFNPKRDMLKFINSVERYEFDNYINEEAPEKNKLKLFLNRLDNVIYDIRDNKKFLPSKKDSIDFYAYKKMLKEDVAATIKMLNNFGGEQYYWLLGQKKLIEQIYSYSLQGFVDSSLCTRPKFDNLIKSKDSMQKQINFYKKK